jgi:hypothetical protein
MYILKPGLVKVADYKGPGQLLLTEASLFAFRTNARATQIGGQVGGLVGALIGRFIDSRKARGKQPEHMNDIEIRALEPSEQESLRGSTILVKMPLAGLSAKRTKLGFTFEFKGQPRLSYSGYFHKKSIFGFLEERRILTAID